jgi:hypothetical protein
MRKYHVIEESKMSIDILPDNLEILKKIKGFADFKGTTHEEYRAYGNIEQRKHCLNSDLGSVKTKEGVSYWVLSYPHNDELKGDIKGVSISLTEDELNNFGFDVEEIIE